MAKCSDRVYGGPIAYQNELDTIYSGMLYGPGSEYHIDYLDRVFNRFGTPNTKRY